MPIGIIKYVGTGICVIVAYVIISNTLWLLFGSKLLQSLPGVNIKGATGTLRIAIMLLMTIIGFVVWVLKFPMLMLGVVKTNSLPKNISYCIQAASKVFKKI